MKSRLDTINGYVLHLVIVSLLFSCSDNKKIKPNAVGERQIFSAPIKVSLDTCPPPKVVWLKDAPSPQIIPAKPPVITEAKMPLGHFTNFNTEHGLALASIAGGMMDSKGRLWFGTMGGGVSCYDGLEFTNFGTDQGLNHTINCIVEDKNQNLWFSTYSTGIFKYDGTRFVNFTTKDGLADNVVFGMTVDKNGNLWCATYGGACRFDGKQFTTIDTSKGLPVNNVNMINEDSKGVLWFITFGGGICRYDGKKIETFTTDDGLPTNYMLCSFEDSKGTYWFGSYEKGICTYDGNKFTSINNSQRFSNSIIEEIAEDENGNIWFATFGQGVVRYDGADFTAFTTEEGLAGNAVKSITKDKHGNLWFGTFGGGLSRYNGGALNVFTQRKGLSGVYIRDVVEDKDGDLWLGTDGNGFKKYDGRYFTTYTTDQGLANNTVDRFFIDKSKIIWIGTQGGLSRFDGNTFTNYTVSQGLAEDGISDFVQDKNGDLWIGTFNGVNHFDGKSFSTYRTDQGLVGNSIKCMYKDRHENIWFGTVEGGVSCFDGKQFINFTTKQGLPGNYILDIKEDRMGNLWFCSTDGIGRYDGHSFLNFNASNGLPENLVCNFVEDDDGLIWLGTYKGFCSLKFRKTETGNRPSEIRGAGLFDIRNEELRKYEPVFEFFNEETGYPVKDMIDEAAVIKKHSFRKGNGKEPGIIWAPTGDVKLVRFDPKLLRKYPMPPNVFIRSVNIDQQIINWYRLGAKNNDSIRIAQQDAMVYAKLSGAGIRDSLYKSLENIQFDSITPFFQLPLNLVLPYKHNRVSFDFGAIETGINSLVRYQYMLEGYDNGWNPVTEKTSASFGNISAGAYTFKLKARSSDGIWSEPISYSFRVLPPWWQTWWFRTIMGVSLLILLYGFYRWRTATLHKQKRILEKTVKQRTAEVVKQKEKSEELLLNILPSEVAEELKEKGYTTAKAFDDVTVLFSDIKEFTQVAEKMTAQELVKELNAYFSAFDYIMIKYKLEKIKTVGDAYVAAGGLPDKNSATVHNVIEAAIAMQQIIEVLKQERISAGKPYFELRIGIHTGPVVAGVVGVKKFQYDIWGDTVNLAARMEQSGVPGKINISRHTYELIKDQFHCVFRGRIEAKNKGQIEMYFVE